MTTNTLFTALFCSEACVPQVPMLPSSREEAATGAPLLRCSRRVRHPVEELVERDWIIAHADPGRVVNRVRDRGADAANAELGDALRLHGRGHRIGLVEEDDLLVRDVSVNWHLVAGKIVVHEEA